MIKHDDFRSFYGFNTKKLFFKIIYSNPETSKLLANLLQEGVLGERFSVYESDIPYLLQFLVSHNLYGLESVSFIEALVRSHNRGENMSLLPKQSYLTEFDCDISKICVNSRI